MGTFNISPKDKLTTEFDTSSITTETTTTGMSDQTTLATTLFDNSDADSTEDRNISNVTWSPNSRDKQYVQAFYFLFVFGLIVIACIMCCNACSAFWVGLREKMRRERCRQNFMEQYEESAGQRQQGQGQESSSPRPRGIRSPDGMIEHRIPSQSHGRDRDDDWDEEEPPPRYSSRSKYKNQVKFTSSASLHNHNSQSA